MEENIRDRIFFIAYFLFFKNILTFKLNFYPTMKQILFCVSLVLAFASCTKTSSTPENTDYLRGNKWKMTAYSVKFQYYPGVDSVYDIYKKFDSCRYDDYITFQENFKGAQYMSTKKCSGDLDSLLFDWELRDNQTVLMMNNAPYTTGKEYVEAKISKISKSTLTITYESIFYVPSVTLPITFRPETYHYTQTFTRM
jgi:hypothetical protein